MVAIFALFDHFHLKHICIIPFLHPYDTLEDIQYLIAISGPCCPASALRVLLDAQPLHVWRAALLYIWIPRVHTFLAEWLCAGISLQVLYLRPDTGLWVFEGVAFHAVGGDPHTAEIILIQGDC